MRAKSEQDVFEPIVRGVAQSGVRVANERAVLTLIAGIPGVSNADIARRSGLGPQTTARILSDLEERDLITRGEVLRGRRGQPATPYTLNPEGSYAIGVEIGWNHVEVLLQNMAGQLIAVVRRAYPFADPEHVFAQAAAEIGTLVSGLTPAQQERLAGIGVTTPGAFGPLLERLGAAASVVEAWNKVDVAGRLARATGIPAFWVNDGSAAAWCEIMVRPSPRPAGLATFYIGTFVSGGVVSGGQLLEGRYGNAADLGRIVVGDRAGRPGHVHLLASLHALSSRLGQPSPVSSADGPLHWDWTALEPAIEPWLDEAAYALAQAILSTSAITEIDLAVINGHLPPALVARLVERTRHELGHMHHLQHRAPDVAIGRAGPSAPVMGAARLVLFRQYFSRAWDLFHADLDK